MEGNSALQWLLGEQASTSAFMVIYCIAGMGSLQMLSVYWLCLVNLAAPSRWRQKQTHFLPRGSHLRTTCLHVPFYKGPPCAFAQGMLLSYLRKPAMSAMKGCYLLKQHDEKITTIIYFLTLVKNFNILLSPKHVNRVTDTSLSSNTYVCKQR